MSTDHSPAPGSAPLILFGGTFDPVHRAHISVARHVAALFKAPVRLMPNATPPHRAPTRAPAGERLAMLHLACANHPELVVDDRELRRSGPSFTIDTLRALRTEQPERPLMLLIGADSLASFHRWHRWQDYPALCHLIVAPRPGVAAPALAVQQAFPQADVPLLLARPAGHRLMLDQPWLDISATALRTALAKGGDCSALDPTVLKHIRRHGLYTVATSADHN